MIALPESAHDIARRWLTDVNSAIAACDASKLADSLQTTGWLRDVLIFGWDRRSLEGREAAAAYLAADDRLKNADIKNLVLDESYFTKPTFFTLVDSQGIDVTFKFDSRLFHGVGSAFLFPDDDGVWKALTVGFVAKDIIGHEESGNPSGDFMRESSTYEEDRRSKETELEADPHVLIVGAGQCGLITAARFRQMGISSIVIERHESIGDNWRKRYPTLTLHTPKTQHELLYSPYPSNWPTFTPRDKLANWFGQYAESQELVVWTSSTILPTPSYDTESGKWNVTVRRGDQTTTTLRPAHIVLATGYLGAPHYASLPGLETFKGPVLHSDTFHGGAPFKDKHVTVIGSGDSAADMCLDLHQQGAASVTMLQRGPTSVCSHKAFPFMRPNNGAVFPEDRPADVRDLKTYSFPLGLLRKLNIANGPKAEEADKDLIEGLKKAGFNWTPGPEGQGALILIFERHGGCWLDVGCGELIVNGHVKMRQLSDLSTITENTVEYKNGDKVPADAIVMGTGYQTIRNILREDFGAENMDKTRPVWDLDDEGELRGVWKPSGHPGLWFALGGFDFARFASKHLALYIKSLQLGLVDSSTLQTVAARG